MASDLKQETAKVVYQPSRSGDGYSYGGGTFVVIGEIAIFIGETGHYVEVLAQEIVRRWNRVGSDGK